MKLKSVVNAQMIEYGITTEELAEVLEVSPRSVYRIKSDETISLKKLRMLANYLHFTEEQKKGLLT
jgi:transcriptional regulator with XRE-family HTH domain